MIPLSSQLRCAASSPCEGDSSYMCKAAKTTANRETNAGQNKNSAGRAECSARPAADSFFALLLPSFRPSVLPFRPSSSLLLSSPLPPPETGSLYFLPPFPPAKNLFYWPMKKHLDTAIHWPMKRVFCPLDLANKIAVSRCFALFSIKY
jgi:hypothetical protein